MGRGMGMRMSNGARRHLLRVIALVAVALVLAALLAQRSLGVHAANNSGDNRSELKNYQHVFVIMMENTGYSHLIGNSNASWINAAASHDGLARNYTRLSHPSQPNYIAATSGSTNGVVNDNDTTIDVPNIVDQLEAHGKTWKGYMQSYFADGNTNKLASSAGNQLYERKHNPFVSYADVQSTPARMSHVVDLGQLSSDLASGNVADYNFIAPDQCNDMHGRPAPPPDPSSFPTANPPIAPVHSF